MPRSSQKRSGSMTLKDIATHLNNDPAYLAAVILSDRYFKLTEDTRKNKLKLVAEAYKKAKGNFAATLLILSRHDQGVYAQYQLLKSMAAKGEKPVLTEAAKVAGRAIAGARSVARPRAPPAPAPKLTGKYARRSFISRNGIKVKGKKRISLDAIRRILTKKRADGTKYKASKGNRQISRSLAARVLRSGVYFVKSRKTGKWQKRVRTLRGIKSDINRHSKKLYRTPTLAWAINPTASDAVGVDWFGGSQFPKAPKAYLKPKRRISALLKMKPKTWKKRKYSARGLRPGRRYFAKSSIPLRPNPAIFA